MKQSEKLLSIQTFARVAGFTYVLTIVMGFVNSFVVKAGVFNVETFTETEFRYRLGQGIDLSMFLLVFALSWALYLLTKPVSKELALFGFIFRIGECLMGCVTVLLTLMIPVILGARNDWATFEAEQLHTLAYMFMKLSDVSWNALYILMGIGAAVFMYLLNRARMVPSWLTLWGLFTYVMMVAYGFANLLIPEHAEKWIVVLYPGALFELLIGVWLIVKGANTRCLQEMSDI